MMMLKTFPSQLETCTQSRHGRPQQCSPGPRTPQGGSWGREGLRGIIIINMIIIVMIIVIIAIVVTIIVIIIILITILLQLYYYVAD